MAILSTNRRYLGPRVAPSHQGQDQSSAVSRETGSSDTAQSGEGLSRATTLVDSVVSRKPQGGQGREDESNRCEPKATKRGGEYSNQSEC